MGAKQPFCGQPRATGAAVTVHQVRVATVTPATADRVTARAFAPLKKLIPETRALLGPGGRFLLLKGQNYKNELTAIESDQTLRWTAHPSRTDPGAAVLEIAVEHDHEFGDRRLEGDPIA